MSWVINTFSLLTSSALDNATITNEAHVHATGVDGDVLMIWAVRRSILLRSGQEGGVEFLSFAGGPVRHRRGDLSSRPALELRRQDQVRVHHRPTVTPSPLTPCQVVLSRGGSIFSLREMC